jgi:hypothetical protein
MSPAALLSWRSEEVLMNKAIAPPIASPISASTITISSNVKPRARRRLTMRWEMVFMRGY